MLWDRIGPREVEKGTVLREGLVCALIRQGVENVLTLRASMLSGRLCESYTWIFTHKSLDALVLKNLQPGERKTN